MEITFDQACGSGGWYFLEGLLRLQGGAPDLRLHYDCGEGFSQDGWVSVPTSLTGAINQLLWLPSGVRRVMLASGRPGSSEMKGLCIRPVNQVERRWRMIQRVLPMLWRQPRPKRTRMGLTWTNALLDLAGSYALASRLRTYAPAPAYDDWIRRHDELSAEDTQLIARHIAGWKRAPLFNVLLVGEDPKGLQVSRASMAAQIYRSYVLTELGSSSDLSDWHQSLQQRDRDHWVVLLRVGNVLAPHALYWLACAALSNSRAAVIYSDEDQLDANGRRARPRFKPDWSVSHARSTAFTGEAVALRADMLWRAGGLKQEDCRHGSYDAVLRVLDEAIPECGGSAVVHVPSVLLHVAAAPAADSDEWAMNAVRAHLARHRIVADVHPIGAGCWRVRHEVPTPHPRVSIVIPTRDALALTRRCVNSVLQRTRYANYEILLVDNQSADPEALAWMEEQAATGALRLLRYDAPFNYSAINNMAVGVAGGDIVCLLNNDTEVISEDWLEEMVGQLLQPAVDVVGAKLLYDNGMVQHAGDLVGVGGIANHAFAWLPGDAPGYCLRALVAQEYSAVTGACLLTWRQRFLDLGGLDARRLPVAFNDVDYCLRVGEAGGRVVWTPHAVLLHHESVSRGLDRSAAQKRRARREAGRMRRRWRAVLQRDPFYNPNLSHERADFSLSHAPLVQRPWQP